MPSFDCGYFMQQDYTKLFVMKESNIDDEYGSLSLL